MLYKVIIGWNEADRVFYIVESDIEGLWLEASTKAGLIDKLRDVAPELVGHNQGERGRFSVRLLEQFGEPLALEYAA
ncbi:MAG: DUF1902 domain-containing protein [Hyphomonadaceae bacterium]